MKIKSYILYSTKEIIKKIIVILQKISCNCSDDKIINGKNWINKMMNSFLFWKKIIPKFRLDIYLQDFTSRIKILCNNSLIEEKIKNNWIDVFKESNGDLKFFIAQLFFVTGVFDDEICKMIIEYLDEVKNEDYRYYMTLDISLATFNTEKGYYADYFVDRRKLLKKIAIEGNYNIPYKIKRKGNKRKIAIITYLLEASIFNSMQRVAMMVSKEMAERFDEVLVYDIDSFYVPKVNDKGLNTESRWKYNCGEKDKTEIKKMFGEKISLVFMPKVSYKERYQFFLNSIYNENPDVIIDIADEFSPVSFFYSKDFPTLYMPMRIGASSQFFTAIEGVSWKIQMLNSKYCFITNELIINWAFPEYVPNVTDTYSRNEFDLKEDSFIILTIGKCSSTADKEFVDEIIGLLNKYPKIVWLIVGDNAPSYLYEKYKSALEARKVIEMPFEKNLLALCEICNVLLRTNNSGGSGGTAIGAMAGLPIAMTNYVCDPMRWLGRDYSTIDNYHDLLLYVEKLYLDKKFYELKKKQTKELVAKAIDAKSKWDELASYLNSMIEKK